MTYLNVALNFFNHPKTRRLVGLLGRGSEVLPLKLWAYCGEYHFRDGKLTDYSAQAIEDLLGWWGKPGQCVESLVRVEFLTETDGGYAVHDWLEHQGHILMLHDRAQIAAQERWSKHRRGCSSNAKAFPEHSASNAPSFLPTSQLAEAEQARAPAVSSSVAVNSPRWEEVWCFAQRIGLSEWKARDWLDEMCAVGWKDWQNRDVKNWQAMLTRVCRKWESDGRPSGPKKPNENNRSNNSRGNGTSNEGRTGYDAAARKPNAGSV